MTRWAYIENIVSIIAIVIIAIYAPGWWKLLALLPASYMNAPRGEK